MSLRVDLNADVGEGGRQDEALFPLISSANIACGGHAGNTETLRRALALALAHGVGVGAHPGYADRATFGRIEMGYSVAEIAEQVRVQLRTFRREATLGGITWRHNKLHGALYHRAAADCELATAMVRLTRLELPGAAIVGPGGSVLAEVARAEGLDFVAEGFADRGYANGGGLVPRGQPGAEIDEIALAAGRALTMVKEGRVQATDGTWQDIAVATLCIHGDGSRAADLARALQACFTQAGIRVEAPWH